jgi:hypothetical protein
MSSRTWWKVSFALGMVAGSLVTVAERDFDPLLFEALRALPVSMSF